MDPQKSTHLHSPSLWGKVGVGSVVFKSFGSVNFIFLKIKRRLEISRNFAYFVPVLVVLFQSNTIMRRMKPDEGKNNVYAYAGYHIP